jgi:hypothetical protein
MTIDPVEVIKFVVGIGGLLCLLLLIIFLFQISPRAAWY